MEPSPQLSAVLFDLDGTLLDTAPDMIATLDQLLVEESHQPIDYEYGRAHVSNGALGLIDIAFGELEEAHRLSLRDRYLKLYENHLATLTTSFAGMDAVLEHLEQTNIQWGIVTNKPGYLTEPLLETLGLLSRCACVVSGDTLPERKPHPRPLLYAAELIGLEPASAMYVGDASRDIEAGRAAGMTTVAATYGFIMPDDDPGAWRADHYVDNPVDLINLVERYA
ncbi:MAG: phosphoglycolate phosphatase [Gammaproteobacteria bacterium]|jgi:phosphoglycolate phosphatase|nr:phosphoglycolate phosphatase [Chromatiales bacterium]MDP6674709.1 phosphoglycolate phosphatase [Gammaproteobacteria bacterium]